MMGFLDSVGDFLSGLVDDGRIWWVMVGVVVFVVYVVFFM